MTHKKLSREEKCSIEQSYCKSSSKGFISWIIPLGAIPLEDLHPLKNTEKQHRKKSE